MVLSESLRGDVTASYLDIGNGSEKQQQEA